jgi:hypothetical protein
MYMYMYIFSFPEQVLNHLFAAFKLMAPFMDSRQDLGTLMSKVLALDVTNGLRQLETVNTNITLIRLWFSRVSAWRSYTDELHVDPFSHTPLYRRKVYLLHTCMQRHA